MRPDTKTLLGKEAKEVPMSLQRVLGASHPGDHVWIGPDDAVKLSKEDLSEHQIAKNIMIRLAIEAPVLHKSGHPGGPLSAFDFAYEVNRMRDPAVDQTLRFSAGHLSLLAFTLEWFFGRNGDDARLASPDAIMKAFRTPAGLPGHAEAGIGDIPFGAGPLGKGVSNALGVAFALKYLKKKGLVDVLMADGDSQEGQIMEAFRLAAHLKLDNVIVHGDWNDIQLSSLPTKTVAADLASIALASGWNVIEVQNGNDPSQIRAALERAKKFEGKGRPTFICYYTTMGHGVPVMEEGSNTGKKNYHGAPLSKEEAEASLTALHLPSLSELTKAYDSIQKTHRKTFEAARSKRASASFPFPLSKSYKRAITTEKGGARKDLGAVHITGLMNIDPRIVVLHADLAGSGGFDVTEKAFPDRVINVGVAEANMVMMAAGMRQAGLLPVTYTFAAFGTNEARANVRLIDINGGHVPLGVLYDCTHAGLSVGEDGETHQDRNYLNLPFDHTQVWVPGDCNQVGAMAEKAMEIIAQGKESVFIMTGRSNHPQLVKSDGSVLYDSQYTFDATATMLRGSGDSSDHATILSHGLILHEAVKAADLLKTDTKRSIRVLNMASIRPLDASAVIKAALETQHLIVAEDHNTEGGLASQIADLIADLSLPCTLTRIGVRHYFPSGTAEDLLVLAGLDAQSIADRAEDVFAYRLAGGEEALVACVYGLSDRLLQSRFRVTALPYIEELRSNDKKIDALRAVWKEREMSPSDLPDSKTLVQALKTMHSEENINAITGTERERQHDIGIV